MEDKKSSTPSVVESNNGQKYQQQQEKLDPSKMQANAPSASRRWLSHVLGDIYAEDSPQDLSKGKKNAIILVVALGGVFGPLASMIYMPSLVNIAQALNTSTASVNATISTFVVFMGIGPLFWASFSDLYGRKPMYLISIIIFIIASVLCGISTSVPELAIFRAIQAIGASAGQSVGAGVISDVFIPAERGTAYGFFYVGPLCGPVIGPLLGGILGEFLGWRSNFYFLAIVGGILFAMVLFFLPETLRKKHDDNWDEVTIPKKRSMMDNIRHVSAAFKPMIGLLSYPNVMVITMYNTVIFGALYFMNPTITQTFTQLYNYNDLIIGLCYLPFGLGLMVGSIGSGRWSDWLLARKKRLTNGPVPHEYRLIATFPSVILIPLGYLGYGWSTQKGTSVWIPLVSLFVYGVGQMTAFNSSSVYLVDCSPGRSASAIAVNNFFRTIVAAIVTAFSIQCIEAIGTGPLFSILAGINVLNILNVLVVRRYGERWRSAAMKREGLEVVATKPQQPDEEAAIGRSLSRCDSTT
ncbi:hypothetical protein INT43_008161 [Umbelopsis isabellina]|uniref:Major facilitator superfamily (MFS) profile domain-containing protein n=1 Tax=Mortierella isabellina TaxID=91625 RepID=A0A8H7PEC1_MORIS|nr:hypothetical protein INT43_008161 [Umbelopsis isabellina]